MDPIPAKWHLLLQSSHFAHRQRLLQRPLATHQRESLVIFQGVVFQDSELLQRHGWQRQLQGFRQIPQPSGQRLSIVVLQSRQANAAIGQGQSRPLWQHIPDVQALTNRHPRDLCRTEMPGGSFRRGCRGRKGLAWVQHGHQGSGPLLLQLLESIFGTLWLLSQHHLRNVEGLVGIGLAVKPASELMRRSNSIQETLSWKR